MPQFCRYLAAQLVVIENQSDQVGESAEFSRNVSAQLIGVEIQPIQVGELPQLGREFSIQSVLRKHDADDTPILGIHPVPLAKGPVAQPAVVVRPVGSVGGIVEGNQGLTVRFGGG